MSHVHILEMSCWQDIGYAFASWRWHFDWMFFLMISMFSLNIGHAVGVKDNVTWPNFRNVLLTLYRLHLPPKLWHFVRMCVLINTFPHTSNFMSNFTFGHNVFKSCQLLFRQNASAGGKGLILSRLSINMGHVRSNLSH